MYIPIPYSFIFRINSFAMNKLIYSLSAWAIALLLAQPAQAQYATTPPVQDGIPTPGEYNNNSYQSYNGQDPGGTWYMTWDANKLYIGKSGGTTYEPTIVYLDLNPILPVNGGGFVNGNKQGINEILKRVDAPNTSSGIVAQLPFRADVRIFCGTNGLISISRANGTGGWGPESQADVFVSSSGSSREMVLSWSALTGGGTIPAAFNWLGYATNDKNGQDNYRYDLAPTNTGALAYSNQTLPQFPFYYTVLNTANNNATLPFNLLSYAFAGTSNNYQIGELQVWDFTMNSPGMEIGRGSTGGTWSISNNLIVSGGTLYFGSGTSNYGDTFVGNIRMMGNGVLKMDQTPRALNVRESVYLAGGSQLVLSNQPGGDLNVGRDFNVSNGYASSPATFQPNTRAVSFVGNSVAHNITTDNNYEVPFNYLALSTPSSNITLNSDIFILNKLFFQNGMLYTGANTVTLDGAATLENESAKSHIVGNTRITQTLGGSGSGRLTFGNLGLALNPQNSSPFYGFVTATRVTGTTIPGVGIGNNGNSIQRYFILTSPNPSTNLLDMSLQFYYRTDELNNIPENKLALYKSIGGAPGTYTKLTSPPSNNNQSIAFDYRMMMLENNTYLTLSDAVTPLPVKLVAFSAQATANGTALLTWSTASEKNNKGFSIERQLGANEAWQPVGYVAGSNLPAGSVYQFEDKGLATAAASSHAYYRLRQEDFDGTAAYSPVAAIARRAASGSSELVLSPVPATEPNLSVAFAEAGQAGLDVVVLNTQGQRMLHFTTKASNEPALSLPVQSLAAGMYIVQVQAPGQPVRHARFVKP